MLVRTLIASLTALVAIATVAEAQYYPSEPRPYRERPEQYRERPYRPEPPQRFNGCVVYEDINFGGAQFRVRPGQFSFVGEGWNDRISSVSCAPGCRLEAFEHADFRGARQVFVGRVGFVGQFWNDRVSSADVRCR